jgi:hypothetical protein
MTLKCRENPLREAFSRLARMPRPPVFLLLLGTLALALASCGGTDARLLPGETAREITANLDTVQQLSNEGDCAGAESAAVQVGEQIEALEGVDAKLKRALEEGATRLNEVIVDCEETPTEAIAPAVVPTETESSEEKPPEEKKEKKEKPKEEAPAPEEATPPPLPPQANGEGKGLEGEQGPPSSEEGAEEEGPSGGVGPGSPAEEGQ